MRNQEVVLRKLERLEAETKKIKYLANRGERQELTDQVELVLESIRDITTLASKTSVNDYS